MKKNTILILFTVLFGLSQPIFAESNSGFKKTTLRGTAIGAGIGAALTLPIIMWDCHDGADETCPSINNKSKIFLGASLTGALIGTGIGALVGVSKSDNQKLSVVPVVAHDKEKGTVGALLMSKGF